jgi:integrase
MARRASCPYGLPGLYLRGKLFWFRWTDSAGHRHFCPLGTTSQTLAVQKALAIRETPALAGISTWDDEARAYVLDRTKMRRLSRRHAPKRLYALRQAARENQWTDPRKVSSEDVRRWFRALEARGLSGNTVAGHYVALRAFFRWLVDRQKVAINPVKFEMPPPPAPARRWFASKDQVRRLIESCERDDLRFCLLAGLDAGLRKEEIIQARRFWFDLGAPSLHVQPTRGRAGEPDWEPKDRENRHVPITRRFLEFLQGWPEFRSLRPDDYVLHPEKAPGRSVYRWDFRRPFEQHVREQGCPRLTVHGMRTTFCSLLAQSGEDIYKIAKWTGDDVRVIQKHYAHLLPQDDGVNRLLS